MCTTITITIEKYKLKIQQTATKRHGYIFFALLLFWFVIRAILFVICQGVEDINSYINNNTNLQQISNIICKTRILNDTHLYCCYMYALLCLFL